MLAYKRRATDTPHDMGRNRNICGITHLQYKRSVA